MTLLKRIASQFPVRWQTELKRIHFSRQIKIGTFVTDEPEFKMLSKFIKSEDWVVDIGANVGHYTKRFSELVGTYGRVIAFEPVPITFSLLSANVQKFDHRNVTLINAAVSDKWDIVSISIPKFSTGLTNYYEAHISSDTNNSLSVLSISLDSMNIGHRISLTKIDAEGHEEFVISGMQKLIETYHPVLIIETCSKALIAKLSGFGYSSERLKNSPNIIFRPKIS